MCKFDSEITVIFGEMLNNIKIGTYKNDSHLKVMLQYSSNSTNSIFKFNITTT